MPRAAPLLYSFNAGEFSPSMAGRVDQPKYRNACESIENFIPTVQGPAFRRGGTYFVKEVKASTNKTWFARFQFNISQSYILEFGDQYMRFYTGRAQVQAPAATAWSNATAYTVGDLASRLGVTYYCILAHTNQQPPNATYWYPLPSAAYEIPTPWALADLTDDNGVFRLKMKQSGDVIYVTHPSYAPRQINRFGNTNWTITLFENENGPFLDTNTDKTHTVYASAASGSVTLTASSSLFTASMVGSLFRLETNLVLTSKQWEAARPLESAARRQSGSNIYIGQTYSFSAKNISAITVASTGTFTTSTAHGFIVGDVVFITGVGGMTEVNDQFFRVRSIGSTTTFTLKDIDTGDAINTSGYTAFTSGGTAQKTLETGTVKPTHTEGTVSDGGIDWTYRDSGYGVLKITGYTSATQVTATVIGNDLPVGCVGSGNPSYRWAKAAWSEVEGWPSYVTFFRDRLTFFKGQYVDMSVSADYPNFADRSFGEVTADSAIRIQVQTEQIDGLLWGIADNDLLMGTAGDETALGELTSSDPLGPANIRTKPQTNWGSRAVNPIRVGDSILYITRSGRRVRDISYSFDVNGYRGRELTVLADHIAKGEIVSTAYQQEPYSVLWCVTKTGKLIAFTYNQEQDVTGWHRHPVGPRGGGFVECVEVIPSPDGTRDEVWLIVKRTINGATKRYIEYMKPELSDGERLDDSFYVDCGLTLRNTVAATLTPGAGATVKGTTGVTFTAGSSVFSAGDVNKEIHYDYTTYDADYNEVLGKAVAKITGYTSGTVVTCRIVSAFPSTALIDSAGWRITTNVISAGLSHLEGQVVDVLADGAAHAQKTVASGSITLDRQASVVHVGLPCPAKLRTMRIEAGSPTSVDTAQGKIKRIHRVITRFLRTLGGKIGPDAANMDDVIFRDSNDPLDAAPPLFTGDKVTEYPGDYDRDGYITITQEQPLPMTVVCLMPQLITEPR